MKLLIDYQPASGESSKRGIGRYVNCLCDQLPKFCGEQDIEANFLVYNFNDGEHVSSFDKLKKIVEPKNIHLIEGAKSGAPNILNLHEKQKFLSEVYSRKIADINPDAIIYTNAFASDHQLPSQLDCYSNALKVAIVYDLIPYIWPEKYFFHDKEFPNFYLDKIRKLKEFDLLLAISDSVKNDIVNRLGIDESKVVSIYSGVDTIFKKVDVSAKDESALKSKFNITKKLLFYISGYDYRKDFETAARGFSMLPKNIRKDYQLMLISKGLVGEVEDRVRDATEGKVPDEDLIITDYLSDDELLQLYNIASATIFTSNYEGFGLPVVESMKCKTPCITADNSSLKEITALKDLTFETGNAKMLAEKLESLLTDEKFYNKAIEEGYKKSQEYTWERSADISAKAIKTAYNKVSNTSEAEILPQNSKQKFKVAIAISAKAYKLPSESLKNLVNFLYKQGYVVEFYTESEVKDKQFNFATHHLINEGQDLRTTNDFVLYWLENNNKELLLVKLAKRFPSINFLSDGGLNKAVAEDLEIAKVFLLFSEGLSGADKIFDEPFSAKTLQNNLFSRILIESSALTILSKKAQKNVQSHYGKDLSGSIYTISDSPEQEELQALYKLILQKGDAKNINDTFLYGRQAIEKQQISQLDAARIITDLTIPVREPRNYCDVTHFCEQAPQGYVTGIQRVVGKVTSNWNKISKNSPVYPVSMELSPPNPQTSTEYTANLRAVVTKEYEDTNSWKAERINAFHSFRPGDRYILLDLVHNCLGSPHWPAACQLMQEKGVTVYSVLYDLLPIQYPQFFHKTVDQLHINYINGMLKHTDGTVAISRAVADELIEYSKKHKVPVNEGFKLGWFHLGCDISKANTSVEIDKSLVKFVSSKEPTFLMVGTIEPRKGHSLALDAFELLWDKGSKKQLCIIGREGWLAEDALSRIKVFKEKGYPVLHLANANDASLDYAYKNSNALISASFAEGYGLPLIEAAQYGIPLLVSDIPVFREVCEEHAVYFKRKPEILAKEIKHFFDKKPLSSNNMKCLTWSGSVEELQKSIIEDEWYAIFKDGEWLYN